MVAKMPITRPEHIKANGMPRMPVPKYACNKCAKVSLSLKIEINTERKLMD